MKKLFTILSLLAFTTSTFAATEVLRTFDIELNEAGATGSESENEPDETKGSELKEASENDSKNVPVKFYPLATDSKLVGLFYTFTIIGSIRHVDFTLSQSRLFIIFRKLLI